MARKAKPVLSGPYVNAAVFCDNPLEDKTGIISVIRIFDRLEGELPPEFQPGEAVLLNAWFFVAVKSGDIKGRHRLQLVLVAPDGSEQTASECEFEFLGEEHGHNLRANLMLQIHGDGLFWMNVLIDGKVFTRAPLRVVLKKPSTASQ
jgi:hypothetical protein